MRSQEGLTAGEAIGTSKSHLGRLMYCALREVEAELTSAEAPNARGLRLSHLAVIAALDEDGTPIGDLAKRLGVSRQATARIVRDLERQGHIALLPAPPGTRARLVRVSDEGRAFCAAANEASDRLEMRLRRLLGTDTMLALRSGLQRLVDVSGSRTSSS
jgi:DNA-binding MarR family transcriptional regulator